MSDYGPDEYAYDPPAAGAIDVRLSEEFAHTTSPEGVVQSVLRACIYLNTGEEGENLNAAQARVVAANLILAAEWMDAQDTLERSVPHRPSGPLSQMIETSGAVARNLARLADQHFLADTLLRAEPSADGTTEYAVTP